MNTRRKFIRNASFIGVGLAGLKMFACGSPTTPAAVESAKKFPLDYGPLEVDPKGLLNLPKGFNYKVISKVGDPMADGLLLAGAPDGMAAFELEDGKMAVVRNHELSSLQISVGPFGAENEKLKEYTPEQLYEYGKGVAPALGGTSTFIFNEETMEIEKTWMSLAGTTRNCSGGAMPWGSWVTCEEDVSKIGSYDGNYEKDHGYAFEVPVTTDPKLHAPVPLKAMGRFNHEACVCDPKTGIIYLTEDRPDGCMYRFIPNVKGKLAEGGKLQALMIKEKPTFYTRNWIDQSNEPMEMGEFYQTEWLDLDNVEAPEDDLRFRAQEKGAAVFARGEGIWFGNGEFYVACTNGGLNLKGQIFRYIPGGGEGAGNDGQIELFVEPNDENIMKYCDNLTIAPWGDVMICEDDTHSFLRGVTPEGEIFTFGKTINPIGEFTGICFSPSGKTMFVNIQHEGLTLAITGPWKG
jgi:secreted PhoX family phosphatase